MIVVVDTPVWSLALRRRPATLTAKEQTTVARLATFLEGDEVIVLGVVRQELLSGIQNDAHFERVRQHFRGWSDQPVIIDDRRLPRALQMIAGRQASPGHLLTS